MRTFALFLIPACAFAASPTHSVIGTQHDLTVTGASPVKSTVGDACLFCHASHNIQPNITPLWDHQLSSQTYTLYTSSTYAGGTQTPSAGSSRLCLSCHDGTVASGQTVAVGLIPTTGSMNSTDVLGTNLAPSHPIGMTPADDGEIASNLFTAPASTKDASVHLIAGKVECTTCHDPHVQNNDAVAGMFLVRSNSGGLLCLACHDPSRVAPNPLNGWTSGAHATSPDTVPASGGFPPYGTVAADACSSCHGAHNDAAAPRNLKGVESAACTPCHSGSNVTPALLNVNAEFSKAYVHPSMTVVGAHDPAEAVPLSTTRHSACADCHNPHAAAAQTTTPVAPAIELDLANVSGYDTAGVQKPATKEYQVCLKCHGDSPNKPSTSTYGRTAIRYPAGTLPAGDSPNPPVPGDQYNLRLKFMSPISHNVMGFSVPTTTNGSLRAYMLNIDGTNNLNRPLTAASIIYCTDCHSNDQARNSKGTGPNGPHGSAYPHLLQMNLYQEPLTGGGGGGGTSGSTMCNKCHNVSALKSPHGGDHSSAGCTTCHDPHGVINGNSGANRAMINFDTGVVKKGSTYWGYYYTGTTKGCYLSCHGEGHNPHTY
jgi:predicted CXXCH cytochrome family protein